MRAYLMKSFWANVGVVLLVAVTLALILWGGRREGAKPANVEGGPASTWPVLRQAVAAPELGPWPREVAVVAPVEPGPEPRAYENGPPPRNLNAEERLKLTLAHSSFLGNRKAELLALPDGPEKEARLT